MFFWSWKWPQGEQCTGTRESVPEHKSVQWAAVRLGRAQATDGVLPFFFLGDLGGSVPERVPEMCLCLQRENGDRQERLSVGKGSVFGAWA